MLNSSCHIALLRLFQPDIGVVSIAWAGCGCRLAYVLIPGSCKLLVQGNRVLRCAGIPFGVCGAHL